MVLELTERETVEDMARLRESIAACRAAGFRLAADDVGAGNAGLRLLSQIRFDIVKIDLSLVQVGVLEESSRAVLRALRDLADRWGAKIVAEGVETPSQLEVVRGLGISAVQGYLVGRPVDRPRADAVDLEELIGSVRWRNDLLPAPDEEQRPRRRSRRPARGRSSRPERAGYSTTTASSPCSASGYGRCRSSSVSARMSATARFRNHLRFDGMTYQGALFGEQRSSISS